MGAGRIVYQELTRITKAIQDGDFFEVPAFLEAVEKLQEKQFCPAFIWSGFRLRRTQSQYPYLRIVRTGKETRSERCLCTLFLGWS